MTTPDFVTMLFNVSKSLTQVIALISGLSYLLGIAFILIALAKFRQIAGQSRGGSQQGVFVPGVYLFFGAVFLFLPQSIKIASNSTFGTANIIAYSSTTSPQTILGAITVFLKLAGLIWFVRGCVLLVNASKPGVQDGPKGLAFLVGGVLALNLEASLTIVRTIIDKLETLF